MNRGADPLAPFLSSPDTAGLFLDFDGTLSEIVRIPSEARPLAGVVEVLSELARRYAAVAVVSGRSARELLEWLGPDVEIWGTHGAERTVGHEVVLSARAAPYEELMKRVREEAAGAVEPLGLDGIVLEDKGVMLGLHWRSASQPEAAREELRRVADELAGRYGLTTIEGRRAYELRPPVELTKRFVVLDRSHELELEAACFFGDDRVDLPGFDALDELAAEGITTLRVAIDSDEAPPELLERADVVVAGPRGALELLRRLAA